MFRRIVVGKDGDDGVELFHASLFVNSPHTRGRLVRALEITDELTLNAAPGCGKGSESTQPSGMLSKIRVDFRARLACPLTRSLAWFAAGLEACADRFDHPLGFMRIPLTP
jgi:hypothetical protein